MFNKKIKFLEGFLSQDDLDIISAVVAEVEETTAGEIVVAIKRHSKWYRFKKDPVYAHAVHLFYQYGLKKTKNQTGILIFLSLAERKVQILADTGINAKVDPNLWQQYADVLIAAIKVGTVCNGICKVVKGVGEVLAHHFPIQPDDVNELPNDVRI